MHLETACEAIQTGKSTPSEKSNDNGKKRKNGYRLCKEDEQESQDP